jgi:putative membrane protein
MKRKSPFTALRFVRDLVSLTLGVMLAGVTAGGIHYSSWESLFLAALLLAAFNVLLKPFLVFFALPFVLMTFGLGIWVINAGLFYLAGYLIGGFSVVSFWAAMWGALVVSLTHLFIAILFGGRGIQGSFNVRVHRGGRTAAGRPRARPAVKKDDDVIDV